MTLAADFARVLVDRDAIARRVHELGAQITADVQRVAPGEEPRLVIVAVMTGAMLFVSDLIREMPLKLHIELVAVSSYPGKSVESKGVMLKSALPDSIPGSHVLLIDDILDSGQTLHTLIDLIRKRTPASLRTCVLLRKPGKCKLPVTPDYVGFDIPDEFVVGYGLDYDGYYRNHPAIAVLRRD
ncbi:MAG TPA: hypoxanthine phosphoribosyltransferase [Phycisphaerales bacterium]|nr:hypoxanthine phosphoribosyltransferase [Phycisphaerales bacterium]